ncbi:hypothetical protein [Chryseolinea lacunae]|uniref:Porin n=1 Tax=Chryseolinea lacunae TaxID=2801331 RepID=A0ABS1KX94_9BACT|nr:hypothetical protein [Chryseolinea lacunae]MBL0744085.1 hypothetical protein [Chryseolinea lacunae]
MFIGHRFSNRIYFFSELELENAKVVGGQPSGEISMEQLFLKFSLNRDMYLQAGLFIPRIGITNENHLPTTFNGNDRPYVETFLIPATWREIGVGLYGTVRSIPGFNYSFAIMNGLNSRNFVNGSGIKEGRQEGSNATAANLAVTGAVLYYVKSWRLQMSGYYGGSAGVTKRVADSLQLQSGVFGTPVSMGEINAQYHQNGLSFKALAAVSGIRDAFAINRAYANNTPSMMVGYYAEVAYNFYRIINPDVNKNLSLFVRQEFMDINYRVPSNGIKNGVNHKTFTVVGLTYQPVNGVIIKMDYALRKTQPRNEDLIVTPFPQQLPYYTSNGFFNIGLGYSF